MDVVLRLLLLLQIHLFVIHHHLECYRVELLRVECLLLSDQHRYWDSRRCQLLQLQLLLLQLQLLFEGLRIGEPTLELVCGLSVLDGRLAWVHELILLRERKAWELCGRSGAVERLT